MNCFFFINLVNYFFSFFNSLRDTHIESHKLSEGKKLENEYLLKQMLWDKQYNQTQFKPTFQQFKKSLDDFDDAQQAAQFSVNVAGEPIKCTDSNGFMYLNKMRCIDENFDEIENKVSATCLQ